MAMFHDHSIFVDRVEQELPHLRRVARYLVNERSLADDIVYEAVRQALDLSEQWATQWPVRARLLKWLWLEHGRRQSGGGNGDGRLGEPLAVQSRRDPSTPTSGNLRYAVPDEIEGCFRRLDEQERHVLLLVVISGMSYEETAFVLGISLDEVRKRLGWARNHLAGLLMVSDVRPADDHAYAVRTSGI